MIKGKILKLKYIPKKLMVTDPKKLLLFNDIRRIFPYTQLKFAGLCQVYDHIQEINKKGIEGSIVERGSGRGGCSSFMGHINKKSGKERKLWLFDSFEGLSEPTKEDFHGIVKGDEAVKKNYLEVGEEETCEALRQFGLDKSENIKVVKGWFEESLPKVKKDIGSIGILRLDADLYEPTKYCLDELFPMVSKGGIVIIDDYKNWVGSRKALYNYFVENNISPYIQIYPYGGVAFFVKEG